MDSDMQAGLVEVRAHQLVSALEVAGHAQGHEQAPRAETWAAIHAAAETLRARCEAIAKAALHLSQHPEQGRLELIDAHRWSMGDVGGSPEHE